MRYNAYLEEQGGLYMEWLQWANISVILKPIKSLYKKKKKWQNNFIT